MQGETSGFGTVWKQRPTLDLEKLLCPQPVCFTSTKLFRVSLILNLCIKREAFFDFGWFLRQYQCGPTYLLFATNQGTKMEEINSL